MAKLVIRKSEGLVEAQWGWLRGFRSDLRGFHGDEMDHRRQPVVGVFENFSKWEVASMMVSVD